MKISTIILASFLLLFVSLLILPVSAQPIGSFYIQVSRTTVTIDAGRSRTLSFSVNEIGEYNETVTVSAVNVPSALSVSVSPSSGTPDYEGTVTINVKSWAEGRYSFTLKGTGADGQTSSVTITVRVPYFTLSVEDPLLVVKNGSLVSTTVRVRSVYGYDEKVTLSLRSVPYYVDASLSRTSGTPSYSSTLTVRADGDAPFETRWFTVRAVGADGKVKTKSVELAVVYVGVEAELNTLLDEYGRPQRNADGTFYPGDAFNVTFRAETRNIDFSKFKFAFNGDAFKGPSSLSEVSGWNVWEIKKSASAGKYALTVTAEAVYTSASGRKVKVSSSESLTVEVAAYDPHFTVLASYLMLNMPGETAFQKPFALIVRYDGNGPDGNLDQRAIIDGFNWMGYAFTNMTAESQAIPSPNPGETVFYAEGLGPDMVDPYTPVIMVDGVQYYAADLPLRFRWPAGSNHTYEWMEEVWCIVDPQARFVYCELFGMNRTGTVTQSIFGGTVAGYYVLSKDLVYFAGGVEEPVEWLSTVEVATNISEITNGAGDLMLQISNITGRIDSDTVKLLYDRRLYPLVFDRNLRYAKLMVDVNDTVADRVQESIYRELDVYATFTSEAFSPQPIDLFTANYSYVEQDYMQPFTAKAYRLEDEEWMIDDDVWMRIIFSPVQNVTADVYAAFYEQILTDEVALEMMRQDYAEIPDQIFTGRGEVNGEVLNYIFLYNLTVSAANPERSVSLSFPILLFKTEREVYPIIVNLQGGGVNATVSRDTGRYAALRFAAPPEAGGIVNVTVTDEKGNILYEWEYSTLNIEAGIFGFHGETVLYVTKTPETGTNWTVTATNVWGATSTVNVEVKPYSKPSLLANLDEAAYWLTLIIIAAIFINTLLYLFRLRKS